MAKSSTAESRKPASAPRATATILKKAPPKARNPELGPTPEERQLGGDYRVIHGRVALPRPAAERLGPDGQVDPTIPKQIMADMGDIVRLDHHDAARLVDAGVVEASDVPEKVSKMGKMWDPPKTVRNVAASPV